MKKMFSVLSILLMVCVMGIGCSSTTSPGSNGDGAVIPEGETDLSQFSIRIGTASPGGVFYTLGGGISEVVNQHTPMRATAITSGGSAENMRLLQNKAVEIVLTDPNHVHLSYKGLEMFSEADPDVRFLFTMYQQPAHLVTLKRSDINTFDDLKGKKIGVGAIGSAIYASSAMLLAAEGLDIDKDIDAVHGLSQAEQKEAIIEGTIDAGVFVSASPNPSIMEAAYLTDIKIIPNDKERLSTYLSTLDPGKQANNCIMVTPAGTYSNIDEDILSMGTVVVIVTRADVEDEVIYAFLEAIFENTDELEQVHPVCGHIKLDASTLFTGQGEMLLHSGAEKYFKDMGVFK